MAIDYKKAEDNGVKITIEELKRGHLNPEQAKTLFEKDAKGNDKKKSAREEYKLENIQVTLIPLIINIKVQHGTETGGLPKMVLPLCFPASLSEDGDLLPGQDHPWIPRDHLEPAASNSDSYSIGSVERLDEFLTIHNEQHEQWEAYWEYALQLFTYVTDQQLEGFELPEYGRAAPSLVTCETTLMAQHILTLYDEVLNTKGKDYPVLLQRYASLDDAALLPLLSKLEQLQQSALHMGQMSNEFAISPSQREAIQHFLNMEPGDLLAVNGLPGTGETMLLQSIVSMLWVSRAAAGGDPPIILAASTRIRKSPSAG